MRISDWSSDVCSSDLHCPYFAWETNDLDSMTGAWWLTCIIAVSASGSSAVQSPSANSAALLTSRSGARPKRAATSGTSAATSAGFARSAVKCRHSRSEEHTSELQSLMRISYAVFCLKKKKQETA